MYMSESDFQEQKIRNTVAKANHNLRVSMKRIEELQKQSNELLEDSFPTYIIPIAFFNFFAVLMLLIILFV